MIEAPIYMQIKDYLKGLIAQNYNNPKYILPSEKQISLKFNSSRIPAKRALEDLRKEGLIYRIQGKGSFIKQNNEEAAAGKKNVCLIIPNFTSKFIVDITNSMHQYFKSVGVNLFFVSSDDVSQTEEELIEIALEKQYDGLIIFPVIHDDYNNALLKLVLKNFPTIFVGRKLPGLNISSIGCDHYVQTQKAINYLLGKGHKDIGFITEYAAASFCYENRIRAYKDCVLGKYTGQNLHLREVDFFKDRNSEEAKQRIREEINRFFKENPAITALVTTNLAIEPIYQYMKQYDFPKNKLEIMVFDSTELGQFAPYDTPLVINQQPNEIGRRAAEQLYNQMTRNDPTQQIVVESRIVNVTNNEIIL